MDNNELDSTQAANVISIINPLSKEEIILKGDGFTFWLPDGRRINVFTADLIKLLESEQIRQDNINTNYPYKMTI